MARKIRDIRTKNINYITEIREFYSRLLLVPLSAAAQALWHRLMFHWNTSYWRTPLRGLSESQLRGEVGLTHKKFLQARAELVEGGYIGHEVQAGRTPPLYHMISLLELREMQKALASQDGEVDT